MNTEIEPTLRFIPEVASSFASRVDLITFTLLGFCSLIILILVTLIVFFSIRYRDGSSASREHAPKRGLWLEFGWASGLFLIGIVIFIWGGSEYFQMHQVPNGATDIFVVGKQWMWKFQHPDGRRELNELHVSVGSKFRLVMTSQDVIHSLFIPAFRLKQDVLPDRYTYAWFEPTLPGDYHLLCTQYCGMSHSGMQAVVHVLSQQDYSRWQATGTESAAHTGPETMAAAGARQFRRLGCISCHNPASPVKAPELAGLFGRSVFLQNGVRVFADETYLRESILRPSVKIVEGYADVMPPFEGRISAQETLELIEFIKNLKEPVQ